jgi:hypothetical protein
LRAHRVVRIDVIIVGQGKCLARPIRGVHR